jgi:hypothetical protein
MREIKYTPRFQRLQAGKIRPARQETGHPADGGRQPTRHRHAAATPELRSLTVRRMERSPRLPRQAGGLRIASAMFSQISVMSCAARGCRAKPCPGSLIRMLLDRVFLAAPKAFEEYLAVDWFHPAALQVGVPAARHFPRLASSSKYPVSPSACASCRATIVQNG